MTDIAADLLLPQPEGIPVPTWSQVTAPYWEASRRGELIYQRCTKCGRIPPRPVVVCGSCRSEGVGWEISSGRMTLYSWTVVWRPQHPAFRTPYAPAIAEVDEGWWLMTSVIGCPPDELAAGMPLKVAFHPAGGGVWLPYARPEAG